MFCAIQSESVTTPDDVITCWSIAQASRLARLELYLAYAKASAQASNLDTARDVLLETTGHVTSEDPRVHFLMGQVATALDDNELLSEAKAYLQYFQFDSWERSLDEIVRSRSFDFEYGQFVR